MEQVTNELSKGGQGALFVLIGVLLFGIWYIVKIVMDTNDKREIRLSNTITENQKIIADNQIIIRQLADNVGVKITNMEEDIKEIKRKVI